MKQKILGLDLGISSVGWALVNDDNDAQVELIDWGCRIFEPGLAATNEDILVGKGESRCAERRRARAMRIAYRRRRQHKDELTGILTREGMLPKQLTADFFVKIDRAFMESLPKYKEEKLLKKTAAHVLPYLLRKIALDYPLEKMLLGRAIYHLGQRRGYKSNRKQEAKDADSGIVLSRIAELKSDMKKEKVRTLGEYFSTVNPEISRIRGRYTERQLFENELHLICKAQRELISEDLEKELYNAIFFQRKLKSCKHLIGGCGLEPTEKRCSYRNPLAQRFRIIQSVNNLRVAGKHDIRMLSEAEREKVLAVLNGFTGELSEKGRIALSRLGRLVELGRNEKFTLGCEDKDICGDELHMILYRVFGVNAEGMSEDSRLAFLHDLDSIEKDDVLKRKLHSFWGLAPEAAEKTAKIVLPTDYCGFSQKAIARLLPGLEAGIPLNTVIKAEYPEQFSASADVLALLPSLECTGIELRNPIVHRTLTEMRRVVNAVIAKYGKPDMIRVELARSLKNSSRDRENIAKRNREQENARKKIAARIAAEAGIENPSRRDILKVMLAEECDFTCPYTGTGFSMQELLHGGFVHIEHIVPYSRSMDDSFANKTLSLCSANAEKGNRLPFEAFAGERYQEILTRVRHFHGSFAAAKLEKFEKQQTESQDFIERNLNDTRYASKLATEYLSLLYGGRWDKNGTLRLQCSSGGCTAIIRRAWGGNYLLGEGEKERGDHRHHAIDALTVAVISPAIVKRVAMLSRDEQRQAIEEKRPLIVNHLYSQAVAKFNSVGISHHVVNKMRGSLHIDTIYSKSHGGELRHARRRLDKLHASKVAEIVDKNIRMAVQARLAELGIDDPQRAFKDGNNLPILRTRTGDIANTIRCVRINQNQKTATIGQGDGRREVANGSNHVLAIYSVLNAAGQEIGWDGEIVSLLDARLRLQRKESIYPMFKNDNPLKFTLRKGDIVRWTKDGEEYLCVVRGVSLPQFSCTPVNEAREKAVLQAAKLWFTPTLSSAYKGQMEKFKTTPLGELRRAHD